MTLIDVHNHFYPPAYLEALRAGPTAAKIWTDREHNPVIGYPGAEVQTEGTGMLEISEELELSAEPFSITLASPEDGPYLLVNTLTLGNPENSLVITSEVAFVRGRAE